MCRSVELVGRDEGEHTLLNDEGYGSHGYVSSLLPLKSSSPESARSESTSFCDMTARDNNTDNAKFRPLENYTYFCV